MKTLKLIGHPVLFITLFLLLLIEGDEFGGLYLLYLLLALPHGAPYAIAALVGVICVLTGYNVGPRQARLVKPIMYLTGFIIMVSSLFLFFGKGNKWETFSLTVPLLSVIFFSISSLFFLLNACSMLLFLKPGKAIT